MKQHIWMSRLKPLTVLPVLLMLSTIFGFSNQNAETSSGLSQKVSMGIVTTFDSLFDQNWEKDTMEDYAEKIEYPIRKAAHVSEYLILTLLTAIPLGVYGVRGKKLILSLFLFCVLCAAGDEFHQSFIPGRSPQFTDVLIDSTGILTGCGITFLILRNCTSHSRFADQSDTYKG